MLDRYIHDIVLSFLVGCIACLSMAYVSNADGRVFTMDLKGSSSPQGLRGAERACATQNARLASGAELRRAVLECSFSACTRGWLSDGAVGTTECRNAGSSLTAMEVRTENTTDQTANLNAFCIKDTDVPCGDPPSFPNTRLQGAAGFELGDELLYACVPGYRMPSGNSAFSLLCDSCGEWYGLVQMCLRDQSELHVDYEDRFPEGYGAPDPHSDPAEGPAEMDEDHHGGPAVVVDGEDRHGTPEAGFPAEHDEQEPRYPAIFQATREGPRHQDQWGKEAGGDAGLSLHAMEGAPLAFGEDLQGDVPLEPEQEPVVLVGPDSSAASQATTAPVSQLSQKHMFWFPSEAFHGEGYPAPNEPATQIPAAQDDQSDESEEAHPEADAGEDFGGHRIEDEEQQGFYDRDHRDDHEESRQRDDHDDSRHSDHDHDDHDDRIHGADQDVHDNSRQEEYQEEDLLLDQHVKNYNPGQRDNADRYGRYDDDTDPRDHYDMGEHDDDDTRVHIVYGGGREDADGHRDDDDDDDDVEHESYVEDRGGDEDEEPEDQHEHPHLEGSEEDQDGETAEHDEDNDDRDDRHDDLDRTDDGDDVETNESDETDEHDDHDIHEDQDENHEEDDHEVDLDRHPQVTFPSATDEPTTQEEAETEPTPTTDKSWLDGYPIGPEEAERGGSTEEEQEEASQEQEEQPLLVLGGLAPIDESNEADHLPERPSDTPGSEEDQAGTAWPGLFWPRGPTPSPGGLGSQDSVSHPGTPDQDRAKDPDPTRGEEEGPKGKISLAGEGGESTPVEGEMGEAVCTGEDCPPPPPPPSSSSRGPIVAAVIAAICAVAVAAVVGAWLYRRRQQKNSMYQLNGKGHGGQCAPEQQIEMQQKV